MMNLVQEQQLLRDVADIKQRVEAMAAVLRKILDAVEARTSNR